MCEANEAKNARCVVTYACPKSFTADDMSQLETEIDALKNVIKKEASNIYIIQKILELLWAFKFLK